MDRLDGIARRAFRSVAIGTGLEIGLEDRFDHELDGALHHPVPDRRDAERSFAAAGLWDHRPPHRLRSVRLGAKVVPDPGQPPLQPHRLDLLEALSIHPRRALVGPRQSVGMEQDVFAIDLVVEQVEAEVRFRLRLEIELPLESPDLFRCLQAHRQSPRLLSVKSAPEVRVLPSAGITRHQRYYHPFRFPPAPPPEVTLRPLPSPRRASPDYPHHLPCVPCPLPRRTATGAFVGYSPVPRGLPLISGGSASTSSLSRPAQASLAFGPQGRSTAQGGLCHRASVPPVTRQDRLSATRSNRQLSGWILPPLVLRAVGAH